MLIARLLTGFVFAVLISSEVRGETFEDREAAYNRKDYAAAFEILRPLAERGNAVAQYDLGAMYEYGNGVAQDYAEAMRWFHMAADQGYASAQHNLGLMYWQGIGVAQNYAVAARWIRKAAEQGDAAAQPSLGEMYLGGLGVPGTTSKRFDGTARRPIRAMHQPKILSARCTSEVRALGVTLLSRTCGSAWHPLVAWTLRRALVITWRLR
jgi:hypothetical protein